MRKLRKLIINSDGKPERRKSLREHLTDLYHWMKKQWRAGDEDV
jgi:hypothetical protein